MRAPLIKPAEQPHSSKRRGAASQPSAAPKKKRKRRSPDSAPLQDDAAPQTSPFGASGWERGNIDADGERSADSMETLPELEREIGIADWLDPQTGEPAEGQSPPHLEEE